MATRLRNLDACTRRDAILGPRLCDRTYVEYARALRIESGELKQRRVLRATIEDGKTQR